MIGTIALFVVACIGGWFVGFVHGSQCSATVVRRKIDKILEPNLEGAASLHEVRELVSN
jgi:hypothetical protein